jgi:peptide deformylase
MTKILEIAQLGNPVLRQEALLAENILSEKIQALIDDMIATVLKVNGVGIAAPQVHESLKIFIIASHPNPRYPLAPSMNPLVMINPVITGQSQDLVKDWEGCLSIPGIRGLVPRYSWLKVQYTSRSNRPEETILTDFVARIFQHEYDHIHGLVFLDRLQSVKEIMTDSEYQKNISGTLH